MGRRPITGFSVESRSINYSRRWHRKTGLMVANMIHPTYLPFTRDQLLARTSTARNTWITSPQVRSVTPKSPPASGGCFRGCRSPMRCGSIVRSRRTKGSGRTLTLKSVFDAGQFAGILRAGFGESPPLSGFTSWEQCVGERGDQTLCFEVAIPSPAAYRQSLR